MKTYGWEQLICPFFAATCRRVLDDYLEQHGFAEKNTTRVGGVFYTRFDIFLEVSYDAQTSPDYTPRISLGIGDRKYDDAGRIFGAPMWYLLPKDHPQKTQRYWTFKTEADLEKVLVEIKNEFIESCARPLWLNREALEKVIKNFQSEF